VGQNERQELLAQEREEIRARIAKFRATQEQFTREREAYATAIWKKAGQGSR
jgi:hypothetical protein